jgi:hypothetical protein
MVMKSRKMRWMLHVSYKIDVRNANRKLIGKPEWNIIKFGCLGVDGRMILKWILKP